MKKMLLVLVMVAICAAFFTLASNRRPWLKESSQKVDIYMELEKDNEEIRENYPGDPKELIELNNDIMSYLYSKQMGDELVEPYVDTIRKLYGKDLLELNTREEQVESILLEKERYVKQNIKLLESKIEEITYLENDTRAKVKVTYYVNIADINRLYYLEQTTDGWKITSWQDSEIGSQLEE